MGLDIELYPAMGLNATHCTDCLCLEREEPLFEAIQEMVSQKGVEMPKRGRSFTFKNGRGVKTNPYGDPVRSLTVGELRKVFIEAKPSDWKNKAVQAYLSKLPKVLEVFVYYC